MPRLWNNRRSVDPSVEPVKLETAKRNCDLDDSYRDDDLKLWITEAREQVEHAARTALITQTHVMQFHDFVGDMKHQDLTGASKESYVEADYDGEVSSEYIELLAVNPVQSVSSITYLDTNGDSQTLSTDVYGVDVARKPARIYLKSGQSWPDVYDQQNAVTVTYVAGYGDDPDDVPAAARALIMMLVRHRFDTPDLIAAGRYQPTPFGYDTMISRLSWGTYP